MEYGWRTVKDSLHPVYFEGKMSAEFLKSKNTTSCMQQNASTEYKSATSKAKQLYKAF
jgi:hypothetical protein